MAEEKPKFDPKLEEGIAYFEKMLQVMPEDRTTLEFLCVAYGQIGEPVKQRKALISLAGVLLKEKDLESADRIAERLVQYREPDAQATVLRIRAAHGLGMGLGPANGQAGMPDHAGETTHSASSPQTATLHIAIKAEKDLVQALVARKTLDESAANDVLRHLAELENMPGCFLVSALAMLEKENTSIGEMAAAAVAEDAGAPPIPLEAFEITPELAQILPESLVRVRGILPFARLGGTLLVATLNPADSSLRHQVEASAGSPCRFYLAHPRTMEETLDRLFAEAPVNPEEGEEGS